MHQEQEWKPVGENLVRHRGGSYYLRAKVAGKPIRVKLDAADLRIAKMQRDDKLAIPTVAKWLGHKDGGALLIKTYSHVRDKHRAESEKKLV